MKIFCFVEESSNFKLRILGNVMHIRQPPRLIIYTNLNMKSNLKFNSALRQTLHRRRNNQRINYIGEGG